MLLQVSVLLTVSSPHKLVPNSLDITPHPSNSNNTIPRRHSSLDTTLRRNSRRRHSKEMQDIQAQDIRARDKARTR